MPKTKVKKDEYGLYVRGDGYLFRPYQSRSNFDTIDDGLTSFVEGQEVNIRHRPCTTTGTVKCGKNKELWSSHGMYSNWEGSNRINYKSYEVWNPTPKINPSDYSINLKKIFGETSIKKVRRLSE